MAKPGWLTAIWGGGQGEAPGRARLPAEEGQQNSIHNLDTKAFRNDSGEFAAIVMGLDIGDPARLEPFVAHVLQQFKNQRMCSPPSTDHLTIAIAGEVTAQQFCRAWHAGAAGDPIMQHFMSSMVPADVLHIRGQELLDRESLIG